jgi:hypothetical protein
MLRITSLFLSITAPVFKLIQDTFDGFNNYFVTETNEFIITEDNFYIEAEKNTL